MTTGDAIDTFLIGYFGLNHRSTKTKKAYAIDLKQLRNHRGAHTALSELGPDSIESWAQFLQSKPYAISSIRRKLAAARVFFNYWVRRGVLVHSPMWKLRLSLGRERILPRSLSPADSRLLIEEAWRGQTTEILPSVTDTNAAVLRVRDVAIVETLFATGMRVGEVAKLRLADWQSDDTFFLVRGKGGKERLAFLPDPRSNYAVSRYLQIRERLGPTCDAFFVNTHGAAITEQGIANILARVAENARISQRVTPHMIRHTVATLLLRYGADLRVVQEVLGHASISTTQRYVHVAKDQLLSTLRTRHPNFHLGITIHIPAQPRTPHTSITRS